MTPVATRLKLQLDQRYGWFYNEWLCKWHHIGGQQTVEIDLFNGRKTSYAGIGFEGSPRQVFWDAVTRGLRKEVVEQFVWVEAAIEAYSRSDGIRAIDECADLILNFVQAVRHAAVKKDAVLLRSGGETGRDLGIWSGTSPEDIRDQAEALKSIHYPPVDASNSRSAKRHDSKPLLDRYQVALSFAGEQRSYVEKVAQALLARHIAVFYDRFEQAALWGKDGVEFFHKIFASDAAKVVMFISKEYVEKNWTRHERRSAFSRAIEDQDDYILPVRFDDTDVPGLPSTIQYVKAQDFEPSALAMLIAKKIGLGSTKASDVPPPQFSSDAGDIAFDYSAYNGRVVIGSGSWRFETMWSKADSSSIHVYNDPPSIEGVAIARGATEISDVKDASAYDFTSRSRCPKVGEIVVLRNDQGFYAALKVLSVSDTTRGADADELNVQYAIQVDGSASFTSRALE